MKARFIIFISLVILAGCSGPAIVPTPPDNLRCEYRINPLGIDARNPRLFWEIGRVPGGMMQSAFQVLVAGSNSLLSEPRADMWNSGKINSKENIQVEYAGKPLESGKRYFWKVRFWDQHGKVSGYSPVAWWETGLLDASDWKGTWIGNGKPAPESEADMYKDTPVPLFRKDFSLPKDMVSARLYISGLGYYEAYLNGRRVGDHVLDPGWTNYAKRIQYSVYDVTDLLQKGDNAFAVMLGNGWFNPLPLYLFNRLNLRKVLTIGQPELIAQLNIVYSDGSTGSVVSDETWKTGNGPILMNNVYLGERYDARLEQEGWDAPGFNDSKWGKAVKTNSPGGKLMVMVQPPVRITKIIKPVKITEPSKHVYIFDMGQNFAGVARLKVKGPAGTRVQLRYGELLNDDGSLNDHTTIACHIEEGSYVQHRPGAPLNANQTDIYILKGKGEEIYNSRFTFHGFRYVEVTGFPGKPDTETLTGLRMNSDIIPVGNFECSNPLINKIQENTRWTFLNNVFSIESDCPGREKFGYGGDMVSASEAYKFNYDMSGFYTKAIQNFSDDQRPGGGMPECAPDNAIYDEGLTADTGPIGWTLAFPWLQKRMYLYYGDRQIIKDEYESTKKLIEFIHGQVPGLIVTKGISDHEGLAPKPFAVSGTAFYYDHVKSLAGFAKLLGNKEDAATYDQLAVAIKKAFIDKLVDQNSGRVDSATQASQAITLYYDLVPESVKQKTLDVLINDIQSVHHNHLTTGIFGSKMMFDALNANDRNDIAYAMNAQTTFPSYGYMIGHGATTIWESWKGLNSRNHPMFGSVSEWFYRGLGGINPAEDAVGFDKIILKPFFTDSLQWMNASYYSVRGLIESSWKRDKNNLVYEFTIPGNTEATVYFPSENVSTILENNIPIREMREAKFLRTEAGYSVFKIVPGHYSFLIMK